MVEQPIPSPAPDSPAVLTPVAGFLLLCRTGMRIARTKTRDAFRRSKLLVLTVSLFCLGYLFTGYYLFHSGMRFVSRIPAIGSLANERILFLLFFLFFVMLVFSNAVLAYGALFRNRTTQWLLTLPVDHRSVFAYRVTETLVLSSWGLVFLSAPLLAAYGQIERAPAAFYFKSLAAYVPYVIIPAAVASWVLLLAVRWLNRWGLLAIAILFALFIGRSAYGIYSAAGMATDPSAGGSVALSFNQILDHTRISTHPLLPSTWMTEMLIGWSRDGGAAGGTFPFLLVLSYGLMAALLTSAGFSRWYFGAWVTSVQKRAAASMRTSRRRSARSALHRDVPRRRDLLPLSRPMRALIRKDALTFLREPAQWGQVAFVTGLLLVYVLNLGRLESAPEAEGQFWLAVVAYLNLAVCALALSTLTTRFVFPQFSLEGRRIWIIGLAPIPTHRILWQKFLLGFGVTGTMTGVLVFLSGRMLDLPPSRSLYFLIAIAMMAFSLTAIATGLGTLLPNLRESNPARIVSGFGGTLCLVLSFVYILVTLTILVVPEAAAISSLKQVTSDELAPYFHRFPGGRLAAAGLVALVAGFGPLLAADRRLRRHGIPA